MPSLIDLRRRIRSVRNTQQMTRAMKMISAARLRRAQDRVIAARPYARILRELVGSVGAALRSDEELFHHPLLVRRPEQRIQLVLITADRGLAGAFNSNLNRQAEQFLASHHESEVVIEAIGRKGRDYFRKRGVPLSGAHVGLAGRAMYSDVAPIADRLIERYATQQTDAVYLLYNEFKSMLSQKPVVMRVLPIEIPEETEQREYLFEQSPRQLLESLLPKYVRLALYHAVLESTAAEHAARMTAMDAATTNAGELIEKLTIYMNRVRQTSITRELIEVVTGAAALE